MADRRLRNEHWPWRQCKRGYQTPKSSSFRTEWFSYSVGVGIHALGITSVHVYCVWLLIPLRAFANLAVVSGIVGAQRVADGRK